MSGNVVVGKTKSRRKGVTKKKDLPPDVTRDRLQKILGRNVHPEFLEWYRQDNKPGGFTTPGLKYQGPGNPTNIGDPVNYADSLAEKHDLQYAHASFKFHKGFITKEQFEKRITKIDEEFMSNNATNITGSMNPLEQISSVIGTAGIGVKYLAESVLGQQYPSTDAEKTYTGVEKDKSTNLTNKLMENLKKNVSVRSDVDEASTSKPMDIDEDPVKKLPSTPSKRIGDPVEGETPTKKGAVPAAALPGDVPEDLEMASLTGTAKEQASGMEGEDAMMVYYIEKPLSVFGAKTSTYKKSHKFMTFGFAPSFVIPNAGPNGDVMLTSYLAEVPWHIPAFYLNKSEFDLLPNGSQIESIAVEVIYRGSTIQFETNASTSGLATLNQINDIAVAHGLNRTGWGSNVRYTAFDNTEPMLPVSITRPTYGPVAGTYRGMLRDYYGSPNENGQFVEDVPKHQVARQTFLYNYWANSSRIKVGQTPGATMYGGWPCLSEKITQMDGKTVINQVVASSTYKPKLGVIKTPLRTQGHGLPFPVAGQSIQVPGVGNLVNQRQSNIAIANVAPSTGGIQTERSETMYTMKNATVDLPTLDIYTPIEKSSYGSSGYWNVPEQHIQPSLHIGVQPVPALSSSATLAEDAQFNSWTDTRAYWEIVATMVIKEHLPTAWPYASAANVPIGENVVWAPAVNRPAALTNPRNDGATFAGAYPLQTIEITT